MKSVYKMAGLVCMAVILVKAAGQSPVFERYWNRICQTYYGTEPGQETEGMGSAQEEEEQKASRKPAMIFGRLLEPPGLFLVTEGGSCQVSAAGGASMDVLIPAEFLRRVLSISVLEDSQGRVLMQQGSRCVELEPWEEGTAREGAELFLSLKLLCESFGYEAEIAPGSGRIHLTDRMSYRRLLPAVYDYRKAGRSTRVRDQGSYGTCWSFASLTALETAMRPKDTREFSADHMSLHNGFSLNQREGGEYTMSMAYLLGWQGPVLEEEDPYGDGISPEGLTPAVHIQEIRLLPVKNYEAIKSAVFLTGGVQSSLYTSITGSRSRSVYYNEETNAYCYQGEEVPNHDIVIVGWDDHYPKENFQAEPQGDGAFLCVSSWGEEFGDKGYFYVSYYDTNIGSSNLVYTGIEGSDNYDNLYQSDLCGWVGQVGYGREKAYGANIYKAKGKEELKAVGFYATKDHTSYVVSMSHDVKADGGLYHRKILAQGEIEYSGFYTVPLKLPELLMPGERFAVILEVQVPGAVHPLAVEYRADDATAKADITDGEGYISPDGVRWEPMESNYGCNLCLKAYTDTVGDESSKDQDERMRYGT